MHSPVQIQASFCSIGDISDTAVSMGTTLEMNHQSLFPLLSILNRNSVHLGLCF